MPVVRVYQRQVETQAAPTPQRREYRIPQLETPAPRPTPSPEALGAGFGQTVGAIGQDLYAMEQHKQDQIRLAAADNQAGQLENQLMYDPKTGALNVKGQGAFGLHDQVGKSWDDGMAKIRQGLSNDRQRFAFDQYATQKRQSMMDRLQTHVAQETYRVDGEATEGKIENETQAAIADGRPQRISQAVDSVTQAYVDYGARYGIPKEQTDSAVAKAVSRIHLGVISRMLDNNNDIQAKVYYEHAQEQILPELRGPLEKQLKEGNSLGESQRYADTISHNGGVGMVEKGNLDPYDRPILDNATGKILPPGSDISGLRNYSTTLSFSREENGLEVLAPQVINGVKLTEDEAWAHYKKTGEHLGKFATWQAADAYSEALHNSQDRVLRGQDRAFTLNEMLDQAAQIADPHVRELTEQRIRRVAADRKEGRQEEEAANKSKVWSVIAANADQITVDDLARMPEYRALSGTEQEQARANVMDKGERLKAIDRANQQYDWAQQSHAWQLQEHGWTLQEHARTQAEQREADQAKANWASYWDYSQPATLDKMSENEILGLTPKLGRIITNELMKAKRSLVKSDERAEGYVGHFDAGLFKELAQQAGLNAYAPKTEEEKAALGQLQNRLNDLVGQAEVKAKRKLNLDEQKKIGLDEIDRKVTIAGTSFNVPTVMGPLSIQNPFNPTREVRASIVKPEDREQAYVPFEKVPADYRDDLTARASRAGIRTVGQHQVERAYALYLMGAPWQEVQAMLTGK